MKGQQDTANSPGGRHAEGFEKAALSDKYTLITGGAGFIGVNFADKLLRMGRPVALFDNLSRPGVERNLAWLRKQHGEKVNLYLGDVRDREALRSVIENSREIFHFAAQVAVTTSLVSPLLDFEINAIGTLNLLEELRRIENPPCLVFTSTNKVYGRLEDVGLKRDGTRYYPDDSDTFLYGIGENRPLDFHSPYGCSKGAADQYVIDYARTYSMPAVVFRMSCIYGPHQCGTEDQGWVAHFLMRTIEDRPVTLYGDGMQVRDILFIDDLLDAFLLVGPNIESLTGKAFNIGGGPENAVSLLEFLQILGKLHRKPISVSMEEWRLADQRFFVSDCRKFESITGWKPKVGAAQGVSELYDWFRGPEGACSFNEYENSTAERSG